MSELASDEFEYLADNAVVDRQFELLVNESLNGDSERLFAQKWPEEIDIVPLVARRTITEKQRREGVEGKTPIQNGQRLLTEILQQAGLMHEKSEVKAFQKLQTQLHEAQDEGLSDEDERLLGHIDRIVAVHQLTKDVVTAATDEYQKDYWDDYEHKVGQNSELLGNLYEATFVYEQSTLLQTIQRIREHGGMNDEIVFEADRIARIIIGHEAGVLD